MPIYLISEITLSLDIRDGEWNVYLGNGSYIERDIEQNALLIYL